MKHALLAACLLVLPFGIAPGLAQTQDGTLVPEAGENSLYERLGGLDAIRAVVDRFVENNNADETIAPRWKSTDYADLKEKLSDLICQATGGPCFYTGSSMEVAHANLDITDEEFARVAANLVSALDSFNVPEQEKGELLAVVGSLKDQVVHK